MGKEYIETKNLKTFNIYLGKTATMGKFIRAKEPVNQTPERKSEIHYIKHPIVPFKTIKVNCHDNNDYEDFPILDDKEEQIGILRIYPYDVKGKRVSDLFSWRQNVEIKRLEAENYRLKAVISSKADENIKALQIKEQQINKDLENFEAIKKKTFLPRPSEDEE